MKKAALALTLSSWKGDDLFSPRPLAILNLHCTEIIKHLAEEKGGINVKFTEVQVV